MFMKLLYCFISYISHFLQNTGVEKSSNLLKSDEAFYFLFSQYRIEWCAELLDSGRFNVQANIDKIQHLL